MAAVTFETRGGRLVASMTGVIDHHSAAPLRESIDRAYRLAGARELTLDFSGVTFMDSSAVGLIMGRHKKAAAAGGRVSICGLSPSCERIVHMSGVTQVLNIKEDDHESIN